MTLSDTEITRIRESMRWLEPEIDRVAPEFYADLFRREPSLRALFRDDLHGQGMRFMAAVRLISDNLDDPEALTAQVDRLAEGHAAFNLKPGAYHSMEEALIDTFRMALGARFSTEMQLAWRSAFHQVSEAMMARKGLDPDIIAPTVPLS